MEIQVHASKNYSVVIENNLDNLTNYSTCVTGEKVAVITDSNINQIYGNILDDKFADKQVYNYVLPAGEQSKNAENYIKILNFLAKNNFQRKDTIVAFGGGVVGDISGFTAATYMRGINLVIIPTSLLAMVDSSVGGKTAIDLDNGKNLAGAFYQPSLVYISTDLLKTLPQREVLSGMGEIIKYAFIGGTLGLKDIEKGIGSDLIAKCVSIKRDIVEMDERESSQRKLLNLGHTIGHAIEKCSNYSLSHGESVLKGLRYSIEISKKLGILSEENSKKAYQILNAIDYDYSCEYGRDNLIEYVKNDKKGNGNAVDFVVINDNLLSQIHDIAIDKLYQLL